MNISRRQKFTNQGRTITRTEKRININFDVATLDIMASYVISGNRKIRRSQLINMRNLFAVLDMDLYANDQEKLKRIDFIKKALDGRVTHYINEPAILLKYINGGILDDDMDWGINLTEISTNNLDWVNGTISDALNYGFIFEQADRGIDLFTRFKAADYTTRSDIVKEIKEFVNELQTNFRRNNSDNSNSMIFSLKHGEMEETVREVYDIISNPNRRLLCGMQGLNALAGGGFEEARVYGFGGITGVGKSVTLLNIAYQMKKYNKNYAPKDPTKIPTIVYLTMENDVVETVRRLFNIATTNQDMIEFTPDQIINMLRTEGELYITEESPINILIKYVPNGSVDTGYLYTMVEDLEDEGYEVIALVQDHLKRIHSVDPQARKDKRLELGEVINEFKVFAQLKQIPVITNTHLNREAAKIIDEMNKNGKQDVSKQLGKSVVGESMLILDNIDYFFIINVEYDMEGHKYMAFGTAKTRDKTSQVNYLCQPFVVGNDIKFIEDFYEEVPAYKLSLKENANPQNLFKGNAVKSSRRNLIQEIEEIKQSLPESKNDENIFSGSMYNNDTVYFNDEEDDESRELVSAISF